MSRGLAWSPTRQEASGEQIRVGDCCRAWEKPAGWSTGGGAEGNESRAPLLQPSAWLRAFC